MDRRTKNGLKTGATAWMLAAAALALAGALSLAACSSASTDTKEGSMGGTGTGASQTASDGASDAYRAITADEAQSMMEGGGVTVVDVRTPQEYADGHIPGAINIPLDRIGSEQPDELSDLDAELIVYCRTGVRSKQASDSLVGLGYQHVNDMGGIVDWTGDVVSGDQPN